MHSLLSSEVSSLTQASRTLTQYIKEMPFFEGSDVELTMELALKMEV